MISDDITFLKTFTPERINQFSEPDVIQRLFVILESTLTEISELKQEIQSLRDEVNQLKGEQGKPTIRQKKNDPPDFDSETESAVSDPSAKKRSSTLEPQN